MLKPFDVIEGARIPGYPGVYVIGCFDSRITFYSQQVRALELVHALKVEDYLRQGLHVAVIGAGAAGVSAAAALAILTDGEISLFERAEDIMPLQRASARRKLDPHIYDWPTPNADDPVADLPILDWTSGPARDVRQTVKVQFHGIAEAVSPRLRVLSRHTVTDVQKVGSSYEVTFERDREASDPAGPGARVQKQKRFDVVFLSFGFGLEPTDALAGAPTESYWSDAGVPAPEIAGRQTPRFLVSGDGDGALIDLVACASAEFDHAGMIQTIVGQAGIVALAPAILSIDERARTAQAAGERFDFLRVYDSELRPELTRLGLLDRVIERLRPGVNITMQTLHPEVFSISTAALNRLAAYLVIRACQESPNAAFTHIACNSVSVIPSPPAPPYQARQWFTCGATIVGADTAIVRRGPDRAGARTPFASMLSGFGPHHEAWLKNFSEATLVPVLSPGARQAIAAAARSASVPLPPRIQTLLANEVPNRVQIRPDAGAGLLWSGAFAPGAAGDAWNAGAARVEIVCPSPPQDLGDAASAIVRLALHAERAALIADPANWRSFVEPLSSTSRHAENLPMPTLMQGAAGAIARAPQSLSAADLSHAVHDALDHWMLAALDARLTDFFASLRDPGHWIGFVAAADLRTSMAALWRQWHAQFMNNHDMLNRFLRLMVCSLDDDASVAEAAALVGPKKLQAIVRAVAVALAVGVAWQAVQPRATRPGNLARPMVGGGAWTGHACAADRIDGGLAALSAGRYMWRTNFVVLPQVNQPIEVSLRAGASLNKVDLSQPRLDDAGEAPSILLTLDLAFVAAAETSHGALVALLTQIEAAHFERLSAMIEGPE